MSTENKFKEIFVKRNRFFPVVAYTTEVPESDKYIEIAAVEQLKADLQITRHKIETLLTLNMRQDAETQQLKSKLKIAVEKLKYVSRYLDDGHIVDETISEIGDINVYECKKCWRVMALQKDV